MKNTKPYKYISKNHYGMLLNQLNLVFLDMIIMHCLNLLTTEMIFIWLPTIFIIMQRHKLKQHSIYLILD